MIFKDKEIVSALLSIEKKIDIIIALNRTNKIKQVAKRTKEMKENV